MPLHQTRSCKQMKACSSIDPALVNGIVLEQRLLLSTGLFLVTGAKKQLTKSLQTHCEGGPDHSVPTSTLWGARTTVLLTIEMFSGMGTLPNLEAMTGNRWRGGDSTVRAGCLKNHEMLNRVVKPHYRKVYLVAVLYMCCLLSPSQCISNFNV